MREAQSLALRLGSCLVRELRRAVGPPLSLAEPRSFLVAHLRPQQQLENSCSRSLEQGIGLPESCNPGIGSSSWWETTNVQSANERDRAATNAAASTSESDVFGQSGQRCNSQLLSSRCRVSLHGGAPACRGTHWSCVRQFSIHPGQEKASVSTHRDWRPGRPPDRSAPQSGGQVNTQPLERRPLFPSKNVSVQEKSRSPSFFDQQPSAFSGGFNRVPGLRTPSVKKAVNTEPLPLEDVDLMEADVEDASLKRPAVRVAPAVQPKPTWQAPRKAKPEEPGQKRLNRDITARTIRLVTSEDGKEHVVLSREEALGRAQELGLDLVEVDGAAVPPVCRLLDYAKHRFELRKKEKAKKVKLLERRRESTTKELRISSRTENKDLEMKAKMACGLLARGYRIKCFVKFKGRDRKYGEGLDLLDRMIPMVGEHAKVEIPPKLEQGLMVMFLRPPATSAKSKAVKANDVAKAAEVSSPVVLDGGQSEVQSEASEHVLCEIEEDYDEEEYDDESDEDEPRLVGL